MAATPEDASKSTVADADRPSRMKGLILREYNKPYEYRTDIPIPSIEHPGTCLYVSSLAMKLLVSSRRSDPTLGNL